MDCCYVFWAYALVDRDFGEPTVQRTADLPNLPFAKSKHDANVCRLLAFKNGKAKDLVLTRGKVSADLFDVLMADLECFVAENDPVRKELRLRIQTFIEV